MKSQLRPIAAIVLLVAPLGACSSVVNGTSQVVSVNSNPQGAACTLTRNGAPVASLAATPGQVTLSKSRHNVDVACSKPGYGAGTAVLTSRFEATTLGNLAVGGVVGLAVDAGTGAINKYDDAVTVSLTPGRQPAQPATPTGEPRRQAPDDGAVPTS